MNITYTEIHKLAEYGRQEHGWISHPGNLASKILVEQGARGKLYIYANDRYIDGDGLPDVVYPSVVNAANQANESCIYKGHHYAAWYPIAEKNRTWSKIH